MIPKRIWKLRQRFSHAPQTCQCLSHLSNRGERSRTCEIEKRDCDSVTFWRSIQPRSIQGFEAPSSPRITAISGSTWCVEMWKFQGIQFDILKSRAKTHFHMSGSPKPLLCRSVPTHPAWCWDWVTTNPCFCRTTTAWNPWNGLQVDDFLVQNRHFHIRFHPLSWN